MIDLVKKKKVLFIISNIDKALAFEWLADSAKLNNAIDSIFLILGSQPGQLYRYLQENNSHVSYIRYNGKKDLFSALRSVFGHIRKVGPDIVHAHLFDASFIGMLAAFLAGVPERIYTRHYSTLHHTYFPRAVWYDRLINSLSTQIVAISKNVADVLNYKEQVPMHKIRLIHHGFQFGLFKEVRRESVLNILDKHNLPAKSYPKIGVIARYIHLKGIEYIIHAFAKVLIEYPLAHLILANATGDYTAFIKNELKHLPPDSYTEILFEENLQALYKCFDIYVHTPIDNHSEAFGQTYIEALAAGVPSVFTLSGVAPEFVVDRKNAIVVPSMDSDAIAASIDELVQDQELRQRLINNGYTSVESQFGFEQMVDKLLDLYKA